MRRLGLVVRLIELLWERWLSSNSRELGQLTQQGRWCVGLPYPQLKKVGVSLGSMFNSSFLLMFPGRETDDSWLTHVGNLNWVHKSWLCPGAVLIVGGISEVNQEMENMSLSLCLSNKHSFIHSEQWRTLSVTMFYWKPCLQYCWIMSISEMSSSIRGREICSRNILLLFWSFSQYALCLVVSDQKYRKQILYFIKDRISKMGEWSLTESKVVVFFGMFFCGFQTECSGREAQELGTDTVQVEVKEH